LHGGAASVLVHSILHNPKEVDNEAWPVGLAVSVAVCMAKHTYLRTQLKKCARRANQVEFARKSCMYLFEHFLYKIAHNLGNELTTYLANCFVDFAIEEGSPKDPLHSIQQHTWPVQHRMCDPNRIRALISISRIP
jgi:hypothetical protein